MRRPPTESRSPGSRPGAVRRWCGCRPSAISSRSGGSRSCGGRTRRSRARCSSCSTTDGAPAAPAVRSTPTTSASTRSCATSTPSWPRPAWTTTPCSATTTRCRRLWPTRPPTPTQSLLSLVEQDWDLFAESAAHAWLGWQAGEAGRLLAESLRTAASPTVVTAMFREATQTDVHELLPSVRTPTLVVHRQSDRQMPPEVSAALAAALPAGLLVQPPGDRPALFLEDLPSDVELVALFVTDGTVLEPAAAVAPADRSGLTPRELEVLRLLAGGGSNAGIARALHITEHTVERHVANLYRKIGARGRAEATAYALRHGVA